MNVSSVLISAVAIQFWIELAFVFSNGFHLMQFKDTQFPKTNNGDNDAIINASQVDYESRENAFIK